MNPEQFAYWLQGFAELNPGMEQPTPEQWQSIVEHLATVFIKVTPPVQVSRDTTQPIPRQPGQPFRFHDYQLDPTNLQVTC